MRQVLDRHTNDLQVSELALKRCWDTLFRDLLLLRWPEAAHRTTSWSRLHALGLGERLDETDFCWLWPPPAASHLREAFGFRRAAAAATSADLRAQAWNVSVSSSKSGGQRQ